MGSHEPGRAGSSPSAAPGLRSEKAGASLSYSLLIPSPKDPADRVARDSAVLVA